MAVIVATIILTAVRPFPISLTVASLWSNAEGSLCVWAWGVRAKGDETIGSSCSDCRLAASLSSINLHALYITLE